MAINIRILVHYIFVMILAFWGCTNLPKVLVLAGKGYNISQERSVFVEPDLAIQLPMAWVYKVHGFQGKW